MRTRRFPLPLQLFRQIKKNNMPSQIAYNAANAAAIHKDYYGHPTEFLTDIVRMELDDWQRDLCNNFHTYDRFAVSSGHSSGKSALTAGIVIYFLSVHPQPQVIVTANTEKQLTQKTWRELAKWHGRSLVKDWFKWSATKFNLTEDPATWFAAAVPQTEHNSEAFAGAHEKYMLQIFDEASAIPRSIYEVSEGATATEGGYRKWLLFGNPTLNSGAFHDTCFGRQKHRWKQVIIDTRACKYADKKQIAQWIEDYGIDSDFVRVRVLGLPPRNSVSTLISPAAVERALGRKIPVEAYRHAPNILGVDCAQYGDDDTCIAHRQGVKLHGMKNYNGLDEMGIARKVIQAIKETHPQMVFIDTTGGYGSGAYSRLIELGYDNVIPVVFSAKSDSDPEKHQNKRFEIYDETRKWFEQYAVSIPDDHILEQDLVVQELIYNRQTNRKQLLAKVDLKKIIGRSPDKSDALALTFSHPVAGSEPDEIKTSAEQDWLKVTGHDQNDNTAINIA